jgi:Tol biopolymer transport system component
MGELAILRWFTAILGVTAVLLGSALLLGGSANANPVLSPDLLRSAEVTPDGREILIRRTDFPRNESVTRLTQHPPEAVINSYGLAWSPDGRRLAYSAGQVSRKIFLIAINGESPPTQLSPKIVNQVDYYDPVWSPDGSRIAFRSECGNRVDLYVVDPDGINRVDVTSNAPDQRTLEFDWSPDSKKIAFSRQSSSGAHAKDIFLFDLETREESILVHGADDVQAGNPQWSPDYKYLAFTVVNPGRFTTDLHIFDLGEKRSYAKTQNPDATGVGTFKWSPDGRKIAYRGSFFDNENLFVTGVTPEDEPKCLAEIGHTDRDLHDFKWSPDSKKVVYVTGPHEELGAERMIVAEDPGWGSRQLEEGPANSTIKRVHWSLDSDHLIYQLALLSDSRLEGEPGEISIVAADGKTASYLITVPPADPLQIELDRILQAGKTAAEARSKGGLVHVKWQLALLRDPLAALRAVRTSVRDARWEPQPVSTKEATHVALTQLLCEISGGKIVRTGGAKDIAGLMLKTLWQEQSWYQKFRVMHAENLLRPVIAAVGGLRELPTLT